MKLSILMPIYNKIATIADVVELVAAALPGVEKELVMVDDGSTDGTRDWLMQTFKSIACEADLRARGPAAVKTIPFQPGLGTRVLFHDRNKGKGAAIQTAMRVCSGDIVVIQDADLEYDPSDWAPMYDLIAKRRVADVVFGSRFYGKPYRSLYYYHYLANRLISVCFNLLFNQTLTDIEVCYKMFTRAVLETLIISSNDFGNEIQISSQIALHRKWRVYETGIHYYGRMYDEGKKITWCDGVKALWYLVKYRVRPGN
jgi:glycosyltransferase involved in cell wall biosynthesis